MLLIADSGSTKCDWALVYPNGQTQYFSTMGFNPFFHNEKIIAKGLRENKALAGAAKNIKHVYFYGAGCSSEKMNGIIKRGLANVFTKANIHVDHDLVGAAYATYEGEPAISCILGTGSNSCFFDGKDIYEEVPALGYILGDEGSGSYFGKILLRKFLYRQLPKKIQRGLEKGYQLTKSKIFENVYRQPNANVYLASFMKLVSTNKNGRFIKEMVANGMKDFLQNHVCCYSNHKQVKTHFVGSIAYYFEDILRKTGKEMNIRTGNVIKKPIDGLVNYHLKYVIGKNASGI